MLAPELAVRNEPHGGACGNLLRIVEPRRVECGDVDVGLYAPVEFAITGGLSECEPLRLPTADTGDQPRGVPFASVTLETPGKGGRDPFPAPFRRYSDPDAPGSVGRSPESAVARLSLGEEFTVTLAEGREPVRLRTRSLHRARGCRRHPMNRVGEPVLEFGEALEIGVRGDPSIKAGWKPGSNAFESDRHEGRRLAAVSETDRVYMRRALRLALRAAGRTSPNPLVGAVVVNDGSIVGEGYHHAAGEPHAEVNALQKAGDRARGGTLYTNLAPCSPMTQRSRFARSKDEIHCASSSTPTRGRRPRRRSYAEGIRSAP